MKINVIRQMDYVMVANLRVGNTIITEWGVAPLKVADIQPVHQYMDGKFVEITSTIGHTVVIHSFEWVGVLSTRLVESEG